MGRNGLMKLICNTKMRTCWQQDKEVIFLYFILIVYLVILNTNNKHFLIPNANICHNLHQFYDLHIFSWVLLLMGVRGWTVLEKFNLIQTRGYSRKYAHVRYNEKWIYGKATCRDSPCKEALKMAKRSPASDHSKD